MSRLKMSLFGNMQIRSDNNSLSPFGTVKVRALLAYLVLNAERPLGRDQLALLFWPDYQAARTNLRQALYQLRRALGDDENPNPYLLVTRQNVQFNQDCDYWLDVTAFDVLIDKTRSHCSQGAILCVACRNQLKDAMTLYRTDLLSDLTLPDCTEYEWWLLEKQEHYHHQALDIVQQLCGHYEQVKDYQQAVSWAHREVELETWSQPAHRRLMRMLAYSGQVSAALSHYKHLERLLLEETGSSPSASTIWLYEEIKSGGLDRQTDSTQQTDHPPTSTAVAQSVAKTPFAGFEQELSWLDARLDEAVMGNGQIVFVTGEAGSGKSTLMAESARRAINKYPDLLVIGSRCDTHSGPGIPYLPIREALRQLVDRSSVERPSRYAGHRSVQRLRSARHELILALVQRAPSLLRLLLSGEELNQLIREEMSSDDVLAAGQHLLDTARAVANESAQRLQVSILFDQVVDFLFMLSQEHSLMLILDDLQWADRGTIYLVSYLGRRLSGSRVLLAGAYRLEVVSAGPPAHLAAFMDHHPLRSAVFELQQLYGDNRLDLDYTNGLAFVNAYLDLEPSRLDNEFRQALYQHTRGNPLFVVELLHSLEERGQLIRDEEGLLTAVTDVDWDQLPPKVESVIAARIDQLPEVVRLALEAASVQGQEFIAEVVDQVILKKQPGRDWAGETASRKHRLVRAKGISRIEGQLLSRYQFRHFLIQRYLYQSLHRIQRARLHEASGRTLESLYADRARDYAAILARHFEVSGVWDKAVNYLLLAGKRAYILSSNEEALDFYRRGLEVLASCPPGKDRDSFEMALHLAQTAPLMATGGYTAPGISKAAKRIMNLAQRLDDPEYRFLAQILLLVNHFMRAEYTSARQLVHHLLEMARNERNPLHLAQAHHFAGHLNFCMGSFEEALGHFDSALSLNVSWSTSLLESRFIGGNIWLTCLIRKSWTLWFLGYPDQSQAILDQATSELERIAWDHDMAFALGLGICPILYIRRDFEKAEKQARRLLQLATEKELPYFVPFGKVILGTVLAKRQSNTESLDMLRSGLDQYRDSGQKALLSFSLSLLAEVLDDVQEASRVLDESFWLVDDTGEHFFEAELNRLRGNLLAKQAADPHLIEGYYRRAADIARQQRAKSLELRAAISLARFLQQQGQAKEARQALIESYSWFSEGLETADLCEARSLLQNVHAALD